MQYLHDTYITSDTSRVIQQIAEQELPSGIIIPRFMGQIILRRMELEADYDNSSLIPPSFDQLEDIGMSVIDPSDAYAALPYNTVVSPNLDQFKKDGTRLVLDLVSSLHDTGRHYAMELSIGDPQPTPEELRAMWEMAHDIKRTLTDGEVKDVPATPATDPDYKTGMYL